MGCVQSTPVPAGEAETTPQEEAAPVRPESVFLTPFILTPRPHQLSRSTSSERREPRRRSSTSCLRKKEKEELESAESSDDEAAGSDSEGAVGVVHTTMSQLGEAERSSPEAPVAAPSVRSVEAAAPPRPAPARRPSASRPAFSLPEPSVDDVNVLTEEEANNPLYVASMFLFGNGVTKRASDVSQVAAPQIKVEQEEVEEAEQEEVEEAEQEEVEEADGEEVEEADVEEEEEVQEEESEHEEHRCSDRPCPAAAAKAAVRRRRSGGGARASSGEYSGRGVGGQWPAYPPFGPPAPAYPAAVQSDLRSEIARIRYEMCISCGACMYCVFCCPCWLCCCSDCLFAPHEAMMASFRRGMPLPQPAQQPIMIPVPYMVQAGPPPEWHSQWQSQSQQSQRPTRSSSITFEGVFEWLREHAELRGGGAPELVSSLTRSQKELVYDRVLLYGRHETAAALFSKGIRLMELDDAEEKRIRRLERASSLGMHGGEPLQGVVLRSKGKTATKAKRGD